MEGAALGLGVLLAVLGPLLLAPVAWLAYRFLARPLAARAAPGSAPGAVRGVAWAVTLLAIGGALLGSYLPGKREFDRLCAEKADPVIRNRVRVEGFYRSRLYPYEAARFLKDAGFTYVEAPHLHKRGVFVRYSLDEQGKTVQRESQTLESRYGVREDFTETDAGLTVSEKKVYEIASGRELARAARINYDGGPLSILMGAYARSSCPDASTPQGSEKFLTFYELESFVLRAED